MELFCEKFSLLVVNDLVKSMLGAELGRGIYRVVYECAPNRDVVLKIATTDAGENFSNAQEFQVWQRMESTTFAKWFAPVLDISPSGYVLAQKRTKPVTIEDLRAKLPRVPAFFTDLKVANWGWLNGAIVCHDYANHLLIERGMTRAMRKADWWE